MICGQMAQKRIKRAETAYYHLMSRTVNGEALFRKREKEILRKMIWQVSEFSGVRVVTYAVMKNHFHLLVEIPGRKSISDAEIVRRYRVLYPRPTPWHPMLPEVLESHLRENSEEGKLLRATLTRRMHDVSWLMKTLKQRFAVWFNQSRDRFGPLWSERFKSVLVEGDQWALRTVAAYIDLNAVRSGLVEDPKDYRFCGYGEAIGGNEVARAGILGVCRDLESYRKLLYGSGSGVRDGKVSISQEKARRVIEKENGKIPVATALRCRLRYFTQSKVLGSAEFIEKELRAQNAKRKRPQKPCRLQGANWQGLAVPSGLRKNWFG